MTEQRINFPRLEMKISNINRQMNLVQQHLLSVLLPAWHRKSWQVKFKEIPKMYWNMESLNKISHAITMKSIENNTFRPSTELSTEDIQGERSTKMALIFLVNLKDFQALLLHSSNIVLEPSCQWQILNHFHILVIQISLLKIICWSIQNSQLQFSTLTHA